jgi:aminoglycoside phosphotransferase (APT) family kinase protein
VSGGGLGPERTLDAESVGQALRAALDDDEVSVAEVERLAGGASREIWALTMRRRARDERIILRCGAPGEHRAGASAIEAAVMRAARAAGVPVPEVVAVATGTVDGMFLERVDGETVPSRILRSGEMARARSALARQCGAALGALHRASPPPGVRAVDRLEEYRGVLDELGAERPVLELAYAWLVDRRPAPRPLVLSHGDFRLGNLVVGPDGLRAVLDWESAHLATPLEDLGWLCAPPWRFGRAADVGGFGEVDELLAGYAEGGGPAVSTSELQWGIVLGTWVWAVGCMQQAERHRSGAMPSVDLAAVGRRVVENEADLLELVAPAGPRRPLPAPAAGSGGGAGPLPYGPPSLVELLDAVRMTLHDDVLPGATGRQRYQLQVCVSVLEMAAREVQAAASAPPAEQLSTTAEAELAERIRADAARRGGAGALGDEIVDELYAHTAHLLDVVAPRRARAFRDAHPSVQKMA